jgi:ubiquinone/menaquinone biosynthesis C-methylase UbiE
MSWEDYYSKLEHLPQRLRRPAPFLVNELGLFARHGIISVLDLGCGTGRNLTYLARRGFEVVGFDASKSALRLAGLWARKLRLGNLPLIEGTMTSLPFNEDGFDAVISISVIHHAIKQDIFKTIFEVYRVLRKDGLFLANLASVKDPRFGKGERLGDNTFRISEAFEDERFQELHHFSTKDEVSSMLACFAESEVTLLSDKPNYWRIRAFK